jgi:hypothetical protein
LLLVQGRRWRPSICALAVLVALAFPIAVNASGPASGEFPRRCADFDAVAHVKGDPGPRSLHLAFSRIRARGIGCTTARKLILRASNSYDVRGWRCHEGRPDWDSQGNSYWTSLCRRHGTRRVAWRSEQYALRGHSGRASRTSSQTLPKLLRAEFTALFSTRPATMTFGASGNLLIGGPGVSRDQFRSGRFGHIRWTRWTTRKARGHGMIWANDCSPNCPEGTFDPSRVTVIASAGRSGRYKRLSLVYEVRGKRVHTHMALERLPVSPVAWHWQ